MSLIPQDRSKLSPMMQQYMAVKKKYGDAILFFRLGDFYEMFFDDAVLVSKLLELTLTGRDGSSQIPRSLPTAQRLRCTAAPPGYTGTGG